MTFVSVVQSPSGGSDWDTYADGIYFDMGHDTGRANAPSVFPTNADQQIIVAQSGTWSTSWLQSRSTIYASQYPSATLGRTFSLDTGYNPSPGAVEADYPPYIALWCEFEKANQYGGQQFDRGWVVCEREDPLYTNVSYGITYNVVYNITGANEGLGASMGGVVKVGLTAYDGNAAGWRDFDGWTKVQEQDWEITSMPASGAWTANISDNYAAKNVLASGGNFPQGFWTGSKPRIVCGTEALNYGATTGAFGAANQCQFASTTDTQLYFRRYAYFQEIVGATYTSPGFQISTGSLNAYNNCPSSIGSSQPLNIGDVVRLHIFEW